MENVRPPSNVFLSSIAMKEGRGEGRGGGSANKLWSSDLPWVTNN